MTTFLLFKRCYLWNLFFRKKKSFMNQNTSLWYIEGANLQDKFCPYKNKDEVLLQEHDAKTLAKGQFVYFPNDVANHIYYIAMGRIKIGTYSNAGKEIITAVLQAGEIFGELGLAGERQRNEFAQAMEETHICALPLQNVQQLMCDNQNFGLQITQMIGNKLVRTQRRLESLVFKDARARIIEFLRDLAVERGQRVGYETLVKKFFTHQEIANLTGTSRQTVTTILNELREQNHIYFDRRKLLVRDLQQLDRMLT